MPEKRLGYLDFIKAVSIIWVVFCHRTVIPYDSVAGNVMMMLAFSSVPCFMMCSGYVLLFKQESAKRSLQRAWHVYVCMVIWKALYFLYFQLFDAFSFTAVGLIRYLFFYILLMQISQQISCFHLLSFADIHLIYVFAS